MELKEYAGIFRRQIYVFLVIVGLIVFGAVVWQKNQPIQYQAVLLLNIGRAGSEATTDYTYDSFYRLQADERFADTVVRWLGSPRVVEDIYRTAGLEEEHISLRDLKNVFVSKRLSSQMIEVSYTGADTRALQNIAESTVTVLNAYAETLNVNNKETRWFVVIGSDPVIRDARAHLSLVVMIGLALGIFIGFWGALLRHYLSHDK